MTLNKNTASGILSAATPTYKVSAGTKKAFNNLKKVNQNWNKIIHANIKKYNQTGDFDPAKSAYYQTAYHALKQVYQNSGKQAMQNALADAAANTGGYGNSFGAAAANRAYQAKMSELAAQTPSLYTAAAEEFANQKNNLAALIGMQQAQQNSALDNAQFMVNTQHTLDKDRYNAAVNRDNALRALAKWWLQINK